MCHFSIETCQTCGIPRTLLFLIACGDCGPEPRNEVIITNLHQYAWYGGDKVNELGRFIYPDGSSCQCIDPPPRSPIVENEGCESEDESDAETEQGDWGFILAKL